MSANILRSSEDLDQFLKEHRERACVVVRHDASDDVGRELLSLAAASSASGRPVLIAAPDGATAARWRAAAEDAGLAPGSVLSVLEAALAVIAGAGNGFSRDARLLDDNERDVLLEDLKVSGLKPGRLRAMTKFFYKGIADGVSRDEGWLISAEEQRIWALLNENLEARRALLPVEAATLAEEALATEGGAAAARTLLDEGGLLIVPDYGTLSASAQRFLGRLGAATLVVAGCDLNASNGEEDYPNPAGFTNLVEAADAVAELERQHEDAAVEKIACAHPAEEFDEVARTVAEAVHDGTDPGAITVACPHRLWMEGIARRLAERDIPCVIDAGPRKAKGDPREEARCGHVRTRAAAKLLADERDFTAWRSWLGLGDWLMRSDAFMELLSYARERNLTAADAFFQLAALPADKRDAVFFAKFEEPIARFQELRQSLEGATGAEAADALGQAGCALTDAEQAALAALSTFDADAFAAIALADPAPYASGTVTLVPYRRAFGHHGELTVICGLVDGFLPTRDALSDTETINHKRRAYDRGRILFEAAKSTGANRIVCTYFTDDRIENANALAMEIARVYVKDGLRFASLTPSAYLTDDSPVPTLPTVETMVGGMATTL